MAKVFLIGNHRPSLAIARALHASGHKVWAGSNGYSDYFEWSRCVAGHLLLPEFDHELACIAAIEHHLSDQGFDALWPVTDRATRLVADYRSRLDRHATILSPDSALIRQCVSKTRMAEMCAREAVPLAPQIPVCTRQQAELACRTLGYPVVIKPTGEGEFIFSQKVITVKSPDDFDRLFPAWPKAHTHLLVQKRLSGLRHNHYFVAWEGELIRAASIAVLRTDRRDGSGYAVEGISTEPRPDLAEQTARLVKALNYSGLGCAQYMTSADSDQTSFLEINPRAGANIAGAEAAGADLVMTAFELGLGQDIAMDTSPWAPARPGIRYAWTKGDLSGLAWRARNGAGIRRTLADLAQLITASLRARRHLVFSWKDPLPALGCWLHPVLRRLPGVTLPSSSTRAKVH